MTEKLFQSLSHGAVPIYRAVPGIEDFVPRGVRWIDLQDPSWMDTLLELQRDPVALLELHQGWELGTFAWEFENRVSEVGKSCGQDFRCALCDWIVEQEARSPGWSRR